MKKLRKESGVILLVDLLITMAVLTIVAAVTPVMSQIAQSKKAFTAKNRVRTMAAVQSAIAVCNRTPGCAVSVGLSAQVPNIEPGVSQSTQQGAFLYTYTNQGGGRWTYTAVAQGTVSSPAGTNFYVDTIGILRCGLMASAPAC